MLWKSSRPSRSKRWGIQRSDERAGDHKLRQTFSRVLGGDRRCTSRPAPDRADTGGIGSGRARRVSRLYWQRRTPGPSDESRGQYDDLPRLVSMFRTEENACNIVISRRDRTAALRTVLRLSD